MLNYSVAELRLQTNGQKKKLKRNLLKYAITSNGKFTENDTCHFL